MPEVDLIPHKGKTIPTVTSTGGIRANRQGAYTITSLPVYTGMLALTKQPYGSLY